MKSGLSVSIVFALVVAGCGKAPSDMADMRDDIQGFLQVDAVAETETAAVDLSSGFAPNLLAALTRNQGYLAAVALEREALGQAGIAQSALRLQLGAGGTLGGVRELADTSSTTTGIAGGLNLSQLVYDGGASVSAIDRATALALSAQAERMVQANEITLAAARAWIEYWQFSERLQLMHARTSEMATLVDQIERMANNGLLDRASLDSARRQIVEIELEETRLRAGQAEAAVMFQRFFATTPPRLSAPQDLVTAAQARALAQDWRVAPALQRQAAQILAAQASVGEAEAAFRPRARLQAGVRTPMDGDESTDLTLGLAVEYIIGDGGRRQSQLEAAEARLAASKAQLSDARNGLEAELEGALTRLASTDRSLPLLAEKLRLSRSEAETARSQLLTGQSNLRQLIEAEIEMYRAQDQQIALQAERRILLLTIAARTGALSGLVGLAE